METSDSGHGYGKHAPGRIFAFRAGYGYAGFVDEYADVNSPSEDGVFLVDMESGSSKLIVSYEQLAKISGFSDTDKILINHITFNTASDRFIMLVRNFPYCLRLK